MDLLRSFNLEDLPEQQTRTLHLIKEHPDFDKQLGFDACCTCGKQLSPDNRIACKNCNRVNYCSDACRIQDSQVATIRDDGDEEEQDSAMGHSAVVCALLCLCEDDEKVEFDPKLDPSRLEASRDRIQSEKESYPATVANVLSEGPCYKGRLQSGNLMLHVIGASADAELWDCTPDKTPFAKAYAEALSDLAEKYCLDGVQLVFVGPDCPERNLDCTTQMRSVKRESSSGELRVRTIKGIYTETLLREHEVQAADVVVFFQPGFTVPDYSWSETLSCIPAGTPFLSATNTEMEGIADCQFLLDQDRIQSLPPGLAEILGLYSEPAEGEEYASTAFFSENPFCGNRVRQNGTMANDLFVKNRWILGGVMAKYDPSEARKSAKSKRVKSGDSNSKAGNPALI